MTGLDFLVLIGTLAFIVIYGVYKTRGSRNIENYFLGNNSMKWGTIGLSVMATQASAITFLSTPGQGYEEGMRFVQNYFGLPIALIIIAAVFIPIYYKLKVYTAYEFLENRFDLKTRFLAAFLFLVQRGMAAGITIYAPAIILSTILNWNLNLTILLTGVLVITYTVSGGTNAVSLTQKYQMGIILTGMLIAFGLVVSYLPDGFTFTHALHLAGKMGKMEAVDFRLDFRERYTFWSGITGGLFLAMSYFGTDQSQVGRYLTGKNITEGRIGLMFNALLKVPMQFFILLTGVLVFVFFQFVQPPVYFKQHAVDQVLKPNHPEEFAFLSRKHAENFIQKRETILNMVQSGELAGSAGNSENVSRLRALQEESENIRNEVKELIRKNDPGYDTRDTDYVFITFIMHYLPKGVVGLLIAVIFAAAMSSTSSELNALASTTTIDFYKRIFALNRSESHYVGVSKMLTAFWGFMAILFAFLANQSENLIEAVNIVGSLFYGTILGIFIAAFFVKRIRGNAIFIGAVVAETAVIVLHILTLHQVINIGYLWYNAIGCGLTVLIGFIAQRVIFNK